MATYWGILRFSLYRNLPYMVDIKGFANANAATTLTPDMFTPKLKNNVPAAPKRATKKIWIVSFLLGRLE